MTVDKLYIAYIQVVLPSYFSTCILFDVRFLAHKNIPSTHGTILLSPTSKTKNPTNTAQVDHHIF